MISQSLLNVFNGRNPPSYFIWQYFWHLKGNFFRVNHNFSIKCTELCENKSINQCKNTTFLVAKSFFFIIFIFLQFNNKLIEEVNVRGTENVIQGNHLNYLLINQRVILSRTTNFTQLCLPGNQLTCREIHMNIFMLFFFHKKFHVNFTWSFP